MSSQFQLLLEDDRQNLQKLITQYDYNFDYLKPERKVLDIIPSQKDLFYWKDNQMTVKGRRRIYYGVDYDQKENKAIQEMFEQMTKNGIFLKLSKQIVLKHLYVENFSIPSTLQRLKSLQAFYYSPITELTSKTVANLKKGFIYTFGYSKNYRPILILRVDKVKNDMEIEEIFNTLYYLMIVLCAYKMHPYHSEKYIIIIDLNHMNIGQIPFPRMYSCLTKLSLYSCGFTDQNFIVNASGIWAAWAFVKTFLPQYAIKKVIFLDNMAPLLDVIEPEELQQRYGGTCPDIVQGEFWPPVSSKKCNSVMDKSLQMSDQTDFYSVYNDEKLFHEGSIDLSPEVVNQSGSCCGQCEIY